MIELSTVWHHECTNTDECGARIETSLSDPDTGLRKAVPKPVHMNACPLCGSASGPWIAGPAPE